VHVNAVEPDVHFGVHLVWLVEVQLVLVNGHSLPIVSLRAVLPEQFGAVVNAGQVLEHLEEVFVLLGHLHAHVVEVEPVFKQDVDLVLAQVEQVVHLLDAVFLELAHHLVLVVVLEQKVEHFEAEGVDPAALHEFLGDAHEFKRDGQVVREHTGVEHGLQHGDAPVEHRTQVRHLVRLHLEFGHVGLQQNESLGVRVVAQGGRHFPGQLLAQLEVHFLLVVPHGNLRKLLDFGE